MAPQWKLSTECGMFYTSNPQPYTTYSCRAASLAVNGILCALEQVDSGRNLWRWKIHNVVGVPLVTSFISNLPSGYVRVACSIALQHAWYLQAQQDTLKKTSTSNEPTTMRTRAVWSSHSKHLKYAPSSMFIITKWANFNVRTLPSHVLCEHQFSSSFRTQS